jgi:hypothetical protein
MARIKNKHRMALQGNPSPASVGKSQVYNQAMFTDERVTHIDFEVKCSYIEIYNETIYDLLDLGCRTKLQIREDKGNTYLEKVTE